MRLHFVWVDVDAQSIYSFAEQEAYTQCQRTSNQTSEMLKIAWAYCELFEKNWSNRSIGVQFLLLQIVAVQITQVCPTVSDW